LLPGQQHGRISLAGQRGQLARHGEQHGAACSRCREHVASLQATAGPIDDDDVRGDLTAHDSRAEAPARVDDDLVAPAGHRVNREQDARSAQDHALFGALTPNRG
jgi:hypothetical protein